MKPTAKVFRAVSATARLAFLFAQICAMLNATGVLATETTYFISHFKLTSADALPNVPRLLMIATCGDFTWGLLYGVLPHRSFNLNSGTTVVFSADRLSFLESDFQGNGVVCESSHLQVDGSSILQIDNYPLLMFASTNTLIKFCAIKCARSSERVTRTDRFSIQNTISNAMTIIGCTYHPREGDCWEEFNTQNMGEDYLKSSRIYPKHHQPDNRQICMWRMCLPKVVGPGETFEFSIKRSNVMSDDAMIMLTVSIQDSSDLLHLPFTLRIPTTVTNLVALASANNYSPSPAVLRIIGKSVDSLPLKSSFNERMEAISNCTDILSPKDIETLKAYVQNENNAEDDLSPTNSMQLRIAIQKLLDMQVQPSVP